ncbi:hypothetical protein HanIR_Chr01g0003921 [Helianthus annuus]|nr:hypothetical protein HanIR_Chr01g0003921 [Helianthus annuus]
MYCFNPASFSSSNLAKASFNNKISLSSTPTLSRFRSWVPFLSLLASSVSLKLSAFLAVPVDPSFCNSSGSKYGFRVVLESGV